MFPIPNCSLNVGILGALVAARQQQHHYPVGHRVIDPVARSLVDPKLPHPFSTGLVIAKIPTLDPVHPLEHLPLGERIAKLF